MASKAIQSGTTAVADTFKAHSAEAKAFTRFFGEGIDENKDPTDAAYVRNVANWTKMGQMVHDQWGKK